MMRVFSVVAPLLLGSLILMEPGVPARAQNPQPTSPANPTVPVAPPSAPTPLPERLAPPSGNLSNQLSQQKGTIHPPNVDPGITVAPPASGSPATPVIRPPGSAGGNPSVVPK